jgi:hypothetical protein
LFHKTEDDTSETEQEESEDESDGEETSRDLWPQIISDACDTVQFSLPLKHADQLLRDPFLDEFVDQMKSVVEKRVDFVKAMDSDEGYGKIDSTIQQFESDDYDRTEAVDAAWHARRFLVKKIIKEHIDIVEKAFDLEDDESSVEEKEFLGMNKI